MSRTPLDRTMVAAAKQRQRVRLVSGMIVTLCGWGGRAGEGRCRVRDAGNRRWDELQINVIELVEVAR